jgi:hypothetical protein
VAVYSSVLVVSDVATVARETPESTDQTVVAEEEIAANPLSVSGSEGFTLVESKVGMYTCGELAATTVSFTETSLKRVESNTRTVIFDVVLTELSIRALTVKTSLVYTVVFAESVMAHVELIVGAVWEQDQAKNNPAARPLSPVTSSS